MAKFGKDGTLEIEKKLSAEQEIYNLEIPEGKKRYILDTLNPLLEELVTNVVVELPDAPDEFILQWLVERSGTKDLQDAPQVLRNRELKAKLARMKEDARKLAVMEQHLRLGLTSKGADGEVRNFKPRVSPKTNVEKKRLKAVIANTFLFTDLNEHDTAILVDAMEEVDIPSGTRVIEEGAPERDNLYVLEKGELHALKKDPETGNDTTVKEINDTAGVFGELALLHHEPRAASVVALEDSIAWKLDAKTFHHILRSGVLTKRKRFEPFLTSVPLLKTMSAYERSDVVDGARVVSFRSGEMVLKTEDDEDALFYIVFSGEVCALKDGKEVVRYKPGEYFGELAMLTHEQEKSPFQFKATLDSELMTYDQNRFTRIFAGVEEILLKQVANTPQS